MVDTQVTPLSMLSQIMSTLAYYALIKLLHTMWARKGNKKEFDQILSPFPLPWGKIVLHYIILMLY